MDQTAPKRRWSGWLLVASLVANVLVLGVVGGAAMRHAMQGPRPMMVRDLTFGPFTEALSGKDREALREAFLSSAPQSQNVRHVGREVFEPLLQVLRATPFDATLLGAELDRQRAQAAGRVDLGQKLLLARIAAMSDAERAEFADRLTGHLMHSREDRDAPPD